MRPTLLWYMIILKESAPSRMGILSSVVHAGSPKNRYKVHLDDLDYKERKYSNFAAYGEAKVAAVQYAMELAQRLKGTGVTTASIHPGWARSNFGGNGLLMKVMRVVMFPFKSSITNSNEESAQTSLHCLLSDDALSILGFGCMRLPQKHGRIDEKRAQKQIHHSIEKGVNYFDTAMPYHMGASEPFLGRALSNGLRRKVKIATKLTPFYPNKHEDMDKILATQLANLQTDHIDYYLLHSLDRRFWNKMLRHNALEFLEKNIKNGQIINAGFSFHGDKDVFKEIVDAYDWDFCQIQYNYLDEHNQAGTEGLDFAAQKGMGVIVMVWLMKKILARKTKGVLRKA